MSSDLKERRRRLAFSLVLAAAVMSAVAFVAVSIDLRSARPNLAHGLMLPNLPQNIARAQRVLVTTAEGSYRIEKNARGWAMRDRGDYPVKAAMLRALTDGLERLALTRRMTSNPDRYGRLGVDDPRQGGQGVLVQIEDGQGALLVNLILGVKPEGLYVRKPDEQQVWAAAGDLPPLHEAARWLDMKPLTLDAAAITRVDIAPREGRAYTLARQEGGDFAIVLPARLAPVSVDAVRRTAEHLARLAPADVQEAPMIQGPPQARLRVSLADGVYVDGVLIESDGRAWLKLTAAAEREEQAPAAAALDAQAAPWAYALSPEEVEALAPPLASLLPQPPSPPRPQPAP
ncbi:MAG: DUF4340 domain-containing protein [Hyphomonadaceae bacterium]